MNPANPARPRERDGEDRRRSERVLVNDELSAIPKTPHVRDLSTRGVFVHTLERLPIGREVELRFSVILDDPVIIEAKGKVVRHQRQPSGMGVEFTEMTPEAALRLSDVVARARPIALAHADDREQTLDAPVASPELDDDPDLDARTVLMPRPDSGAIARAFASKDPSEENRS